MDAATQRQTEIEDALRYAARRRAEDAALGLNTPSEDLRQTRTARYRFRSQAPRTRVVGVAVTIEEREPTPEMIERLASGNVTPSVKITRADGTVTRERISHTRESRETVRQTRAAATPETARFTTGHDFTS